VHSEWLTRPSSHATVSTAMPGVPLLGRTLLVVEDHPPIREFLRRALQQIGAGVLVAATAEVALQLLEDAVPDLILVDLATPGMGGVALARGLRADTLCRQIKLVAITGLSGSDHRREIIAAGFDAQLDKP